MTIQSVLWANELFDRARPSMFLLRIVRQDTISRLEKRSDMLLSTMRHYVESMGGKLELVAKFPDRPSVVIDHLGGDVTLNKRVSAARRSRAAV